MVTYQHPVAFLLGLEGIALLRAYAGDGFDRSFVEARIAEVRDILLTPDGPMADEGLEVGQFSTVEGYRWWAAHYDAEDNPLIRVEEPVVHRILDSLAPGDALDAACGTGRHTRYLHAQGHRVIGVDSSPDMLARARAGNPGVEFLAGDLHALPVPDEGVDLVVCALALPHVPALSPVLAEFARVLRPGGHLVTSDIHVLSMYLGSVAGGNDADGKRHLMPASRYLASDYLSAAIPLGLQVLECHEPGRLPTDVLGGPLAREWCPEAADAVYDAVPAAMIWHFQRA